MAGHRRKREAEAAARLAAEREAAAEAEGFASLLLPEGEDEDPGGDEPDDEADAPVHGVVVSRVSPRVYRSRKYDKTPEVMAEILERLSAGELLKDICSEARLLSDPRFPPAYVVYQWRRAEPEGFGAEFAAAQASCLDRMAEGLLEIAADEARDFRINDKGRIVWNGHAVRRAETIINTRKWLMSKLRPDVYGDRVEVRTPASEGLDKVSNEDLAAQLLALVGPEGAAALADDAVATTEDRGDGD